MDGASASVRANSWGNIVESKILNDVHDVEQEVEGEGKKGEVSWRIAARRCAFA